MASQQAMVLCNAAVQSSQQDDQLSEASAFGSPIQPPEPLINPSAPTVSNPELISSLPPVPARLRDRIIAGEYIDFNSLLTGAMFSMCDGPLTHQSTSPSLTDVSSKWRVSSHTSTHKISGCQMKTQTFCRQQAKLRHGRKVPSGGICQTKVIWNYGWCRIFSGMFSTSSWHSDLL